MLLIHMLVQSAIASESAVDSHRHLVGLIFVGDIVGSAIGWITVRRWRPRLRTPEWWLKGDAATAFGLVGGVLGYLIWLWW